MAFLHSTTAKFSRANPWWIWMLISHEANTLHKAALKAISHPIFKEPTQLVAGNASKAVRMTLVNLSMNFV